MNGYITGEIFASRLAQLSMDVNRGIWTEEGVIRVLNDLRDELVQKANRTPAIAAAEVFEDPEIGTNHKVRAVKKIKALTGCGLKEAKEAYEQELPKFLVKRIEALYVELNQANAQVPWNMARYPDDPC